MSKYGDWRLCMRKILGLGLGLVSSVLLSGSATLGVVSGSRGSSKMSANCLALAMYLRSWSGRKLHSLKKSVSQPESVIVTQFRISVSLTLVARGGSV